MPEPSDTDWAYAAGFVDGEGCIAISRSFVNTRNRYYYSVQVVVTNRDRGVLDWMQSVWGGWVVAGTTPIGHAQRAWNWRAPTGTSALSFLNGLRPWLRIKGAQCDNALAMIELLRPGRRLGKGRQLPQSIRDKQEQLYWLQREMNHRGSARFVRKPMHSPRKINREQRRESVDMGNAHYRKPRVELRQAVQALPDRPSRPSSSGFVIRPSATTVPSTSSTGTRKS